MKQDTYSFGLKSAIVFLQCVCVGIIAAALLTVNYWLDGTWRFSQLGRSFEESAVFLRDTEDAIRREVNRSLNEALFTKDGVVDMDKEIDIRQYSSGVDDEANRNENLTYRLSDLINFYPQTAALSRAMEEILTGQGAGISGRMEDSWDALCGAETACGVILPVSAHPLSETARASQTPFETLLGYYQNLVWTSTDVHSRYLDFEEDEKLKLGAADSFAPSNIAYYIENTSTKQSFTNIGVKGVAAARSAISDDPGLTFLFDGVRSMDIMVDNTDLTLNEEAASYFMDTVFQGSNERVTIGVNLSFPAGDRLRSDYLLYQKRKPAVVLALSCALTALILLCLLLAMSIHTTGRSDADTPLSPEGFDLLPAEIAAGICVAAALSWIYFSRMILHAFIFPVSWNNAWITAAVIGEYLICLLSFLGLIRRIRLGNLWRGSVLHMILRVSSQVLEARAASTRMLIFFAAFIFLNFVLLRFFDTVGIISVIVLDLAMLLYLLRDRLGKLSVRAGLRELSKGKLDYRIDTGSLTGDSLEMAEAVNEMGDGLQEAVDSMVRSERLKVELITNLSHDLKTPLTSIINYVDLIKREQPENERMQAYIDVLDRKSQRLKILINDLVDISRISSGNVELHMASIDLRAMVQMAAGEFEDRFEQIPLKMEMETEGTWMITADGDKLWRVLDNLLGNIEKYAMPGSTVRIRILQAGRMAVCSFENQSKDPIEKSAGELQERFVRGDESRTSEGSGLGLSISQSLTELMGGSFRIETTTSAFRAELSFEMVSPPVNVS